MRIEHIALWVKDIEKMKSFYTEFFHAEANSLYVNQQKKISSYFLTFSTGARIELMHKSDEYYNSETNLKAYSGYAHFAISLGNKAAVDTKTEEIRRNGWDVVGEPRTTGDGYYESVILDPEGNKIELTI